jgi:cytochrome P450
MQNMLLFVQMRCFFLKLEWLLKLPAEANRKRREFAIFIRNTVKQIIINKKERGAEGCVDVISLAMNDKFGISKEEDRVNLMTNMLAAGHGKSALVLQFMVWILGRSPAVQATSRERVRSRLSTITVYDLSLDVADSKPWDAEMVHSLPYLDTVLMEASRI